MSDRCVEDCTVTVHVPMTFAIRGGRKTIVSGDLPATRQAKFDSALLKALAKAHRWRQLLESGEYASISELAQSQGVNRSYACRVLRLTLLAPSIVTDILNGRHSPDLMLKRLARPFPTEWNEQLDALKET